MRIIGGLSDKTLLGCNSAMLLIHLLEGIKKPIQGLNEAVHPSHVLGIQLNGGGSLNLI